MCIRDRLVDNSDQQGAPIVVDDHPTAVNLLGCVERESEMGALVTDFTLIRAGSLHKANGGFLVLHVEDPVSYTHLDVYKRQVGNRQRTRHARANFTYVGVRRLAKRGRAGTEQFGCRGQLHMHFQANNGFISGHKSTYSLLGDQL